MTQFEEKDFFMSYIFSNIKHIYDCMMSLENLPSANGNILNR